MMLANKLCVVQLLYLALFLATSQSYKLFDRPSDCEAEAKELWSYRGNNGPKYWGERYPACYGEKQSPIDIRSDKAVRDRNLAPLGFNNYAVPITQAKIVNNGHTIQLTPGDNVERSINVEGTTYKLDQLHFHWGPLYSRGSEHTIDGNQYAMEMHLVHQSKNGKLAVVAVIFRQHSTANDELQHIVDELRKLQFKGDTTSLSSSLNLNNLLPSNTACYYRYDGSLTTPACTEGVKWSVLSEIVDVGIHQIKEFRTVIYSVTKNEANFNCKLINNYRPVQPVNDRTVYSSA